MADEANVPPQDENLGVEIDAELYRFNQKGLPYEIIDSAVAEVVIKKTPLMVVAGKPYVYHDGVFKLDVENIFLYSLVRQEILPELVTDSRIVRVCKLILKDHRLQVGIDEVNAFPVNWICFKNGMLNVLTGEMHPHDPCYRVVNGIPHNFISGLEKEFESTSYSQFLRSRLDSDSIRQLLDYQGICLLHDNIVTKFLVLVGTANAGKSIILNLTERIVGHDNVSAVPLQALGERFTTASLLHKTVNICGDLSNAPLKDTSVVKQLTGDDFVKGEYKAGSIFFFRNHARFLFSCNELPTILDERSNGFFRRISVIRFTKEGDFIPDLKNALCRENEIETILSYLVFRVKSVLVSGQIFEAEGNLREVSQLRSDSDSVEAFLKGEVTPDKDGRVRRPDLFAAYEDFCRQEERLSLGKTAFFRALRTKGYNERKSCGEIYICGIKLEFADVDETPFD